MGSNAKLQLEVFTLLLSRSFHWHLANTVLMITRDKPSAGHTAQGLVGAPVEMLCFCAVLVPLVGVRHNHQQAVSATVLKLHGSARGGSSYLPLEFNKWNNSGIISISLEISARGEKGEFSCLLLYFQAHNIQVYITSQDSWRPKEELIISITNRIACRNKCQPATSFWSQQPPAFTEAAAFTSGR